MSRALTSLPPLRWLFSAWSAIDAETAPTPGAETARERQILVAAALLLVLGYSFGDTTFFSERIAPQLAAHGFQRLLDRYAELCGFSYWAVAKVLGFGILPLLHLKLLGEKLRDYGLFGTPGRSWWRIYLLLFALIAPALVVASRQPGFLAVYPFYRQSGRSWFDFTVWEAQYLLTFFAVEFFFRGYLLFGLRRRLGSLAIFVAMVPYCMVHVGKPPAEALGSIVAGILLGTLALRTGSIWCGVLLHVSVALTMDVLAAWQGHALPK